MKIVFYFPFHATPEFGPETILRGTAAASGTQSSIRLGRSFVARGHEVSVVHHVPNQATSVEGLTLLHAKDEKEATNEMARLLDGSVVILPPTGALGVLRRLEGVRLIKLVWLHNNRSIDWMEAAFRSGLSRAICVTAASSTMYRCYGYQRHVEVVNYALRDSIAFPKPCPEPERVAFVGALNIGKGFQLVLQAWPMVRERRPAAVLHVYGSNALHSPSAPCGPSGMMSPEFEAKWWAPLVENMGGEDRTGVRFHGALQKESLFADVARATVGVVNPSVDRFTETFCLSAVETQACGVPCIGGGAGGLLDTIANGFSGLHLKSERPEELAARIVEVLEDRELQRRLSAGALSHAARFTSTEREALEFEGVIDRAVKGVPAPRESRSARDVLRWLGYGTLKITAKKLLRPDPEVLRNA